ncbi:GNAT family N-acetyltransferase [Haloplanus sp. C73]|uniref:GNAT family N-acetyltransferase n=1 Tax=Haloplanus sp. C73 TaxID=3421641 RepID=UPI003EB927A6
MMVDIELRRDASDAGDEVRRLLREASDEFVPPLAGREGTTQTDDLDDTDGDDLDTYYQQCIEQTFLLAWADESLAGFLSFRHDYTADALDGYTPANYVSTIIVDESHRRQGVATALYRALLTELPPALELPYVATRTWSTNDSHLTLLRDLGFERIETIPDDRGEGIDTVYYAIDVASVNPDADDSD